MKYSMFGYFVGLPRQYVNGDEQNDSRFGAALDFVSPNQALMDATT